MSNSKKENINEIYEIIWYGMFAYWKLFGGRVGSAARQCECPAQHCSTLVKNAASHCTCGSSSNDNMP